MKFKGLINKLMLVGVLSSFVFLYSCGEDDPEVPTAALPTLTITTTPASAATNAEGTMISVEQGTALGIDIVVTAPGGFNAFRTEGLGSDLDLSRDALDVSAGTTLVEIPTINFNTEMAGEFSFDILAVDDIGTGQVGRETINIIITPPASPMARTQTTTLIAPPLGNEMSETFYSVSENRTYTLMEVDDAATAVSENIDFGYFYGNEANLVSPSIYVSFTGLGSTVYGNSNDGLPAWTRRNETRMVLTTLTNTSEITTVADVTAAVDGITFDDEELVVEGLEVGQVYAFRTQEGTVGLFTVTTLMGGNGNAEGTGITLDIILASGI